MEVDLLLENTKAILLKLNLERSGTTMPHAKLIAFRGLAGSLVTSGNYCAPSMGWENGVFLVAHMTSFPGALSNTNIIFEGMNNAATYLDVYFEAFGSGKKNHAYQLQLKVRCDIMS